VGDIQQIAKQFLTAYDLANRYTDAKTVKQEELFQKFDEELEKKTLIRRSVHVPNSASNPEDWIKVYHPGFRIVKHEKTHYGEDSYKTYLIEEDPSFKKHTYVEYDEGMVIGRTIVEGPPSLDDERLRAEHPSLWIQITEWPEPWWSLVNDVWKLASHEEPDKAWVEDFLRGRGIQRVLKPFDQLTTGQLALLQPYIVPGPKSVRLVPPRPAKPEELEG
jgi:hypothetical protein